MTDKYETAAREIVGRVGTDWTIDGKLTEAEAQDTKNTLVFDIAASMRGFVETAVLAERGDIVAVHRRQATHWTQQGKVALERKDEILARVMDARRAAHVDAGNEIDARPKP